jgi:hypothetical protein
MNRVDRILKTSFEKTLAEHGLSHSNDTHDNIYKLTYNDPDNVITAQFIVSEPGNESTFGIRGIQAIGNFRFTIPPPGVTEPGFYVFAFMNSCNNSVEFIIIPSTELEERIKYRNRTISDDQETELVFWLMEERTLYDTTGLGAEGRWWFIEGRMADNDNSFRSYTELLNSWEILSIK